MNQILTMLETFSHLIAGPAIVLGLTTLLGAAILIYSQRGKMQELKLRIAETEASDHK